MGRNGRDMARAKLSRGRSPGRKIGVTLITSTWGGEKTGFCMCIIPTSGVGMVHENRQGALVVVQDVLLKRVVVRVGPGVVVIVIVVVIDVAVGVDLKMGKII